LRVFSVGTSSVDFFGSFRGLQTEANRLIRLAVQSENLSYFKAMAKFIGLDCGWFRARYAPLTDGEYDEVCRAMETLGSSERTRGKTFDKFAERGRQDENETGLMRRLAAVAAVLWDAGCPGERRAALVRKVFNCRLWRVPRKSGVARPFFRRTQRHGVAGGRCHFCDRPLVEGGRKRYRAEV
jgi:hypothetical protein